MNQRGATAGKEGEPAGVNKSYSNNMATRDTPTYTITPFSGQPGQDWEDFEDELYNALAMKTAVIPAIPP